VQTLDRRQYEVIVTDDGNSGSARLELAATHSWVRVVNGPGHGPAANRNAGASAAHGNWIAFTDDDTEPNANWLSAFIKARIEGVHVYEGRTTCDGGFRSPLFHAPENLTGGRLWSCNILIRSVTFAAVGGFDEAFQYPHMEDQDLRLRLLAAGERILFVPEAIVNHPPRRQPPGDRLGAYRESEVRYLYKHGAARPVRGQLYARIIRYRIGVIRSGELILVEDKAVLMRKLGKKQLTLQLAQPLAGIPAQLSGLPLELGAVGYGVGGKISVQFDRRVWHDYGRNGTVLTERAWGHLWETSDDQSGDRGVLTNLLSSHDGAAFAALPEAPDRIVAEIERLFPGAKGLSGERVHTDWTNDPMSLGAYSCFGPGQLAAAAPFLRSAHGRLLLAGEHTDEFSGFMEGALRSGARVAAMIGATTRPDS